MELLQSATFSSTPDLMGLYTVKVLAWGYMKRDTHWHQPGRGFFTIPKGTKVRRVKTKNRRERGMVTRPNEPRTRVMVRLLGMRRVIFWNDAIWEDETI